MKCHLCIGAFLLTTAVMISHQELLFHMPQSNGAKSMLLDKNLFVNVLPDPTDKRPPRLTNSNPTKGLQYHLI
jgi:hypothetical protein